MAQHNVDMKMPFHFSPKSDSSEIYFWNFLHVNFFSTCSLQWSKRSWEKYTMRSELKTNDFLVHWERWESTRRERTLQTPSKHIFHWIFLIFNFTIDKHINAPFNGGICSSFKTYENISAHKMEPHKRPSSNHDQPLGQIWGSIF